MKRRLITSAIMVPLAISAFLFMPSIGMLFLILIIATATSLEFYKLLNAADIPAFRYVGALLGAILITVTYISYNVYTDPNPIVVAARAAEWEMVVIAFSVLVLLIRQFPQKHNDKPLSTISCTMLGILYTAVLANFYTKLALSFEPVSWRQPLRGTTGMYLIFYMTWVTKWTDAGALFVGSAIGKHKLFPRLSPGKTWEGLAGGLSFGMIFSCIFAAVCKWQFGLIEMSVPRALAVGLALGIAGMVGDLAESLMKRAAATKDSGGFAPGIGGALDIFDSLLFAGPVMYVCARLFLT